MIVEMVVPVDVLSGLINVQSSRARKRVGVVVVVGGDELEDAGDLNDSTKRANYGRLIKAALSGGPNTPPDTLNLRRKSAFVFGLNCIRPIRGCQWAS